MKIGAFENSPPKFVIEGQLLQGWKITTLPDACKFALRRHLEVVKVWEHADSTISA
jgi:hypothetical protein